MSEQLIQTPCSFGENDNFLLERELGTGGMGGVYMGRDKMLDRPIAVKIMQKSLGEDAEFVEKFKKEAQSAARLIHPNIAQIYSYGICKGLPYIAMELASGGSLFSLMSAAKGKTDIARVIKICQQVAQALQCANDQGLVHGDVKPENILLDSNGNAKLVDFGLAGMQKNTDEIWGTPYYISPEKVKKEEIDFRSDMYSLGGTLYHALTGVAPFEGADMIAVVKKRFDGAPQKPSAIRPELTPAIDALILKMLALDKNARFPSFEALLESFKNVLANGLTATAKGGASAAPKAATSATASGKKGITIRTRRMVTTNPAARSQGSTISRRKAMIRKPTRVERATETYEEEEDEGGGIGVKVLAAIFGVILLIGGVIGGLVWYQVSDRKAREADELAQLTAGYTQAYDAITNAFTSASKFGDECDAFAEKAIAECQKPTDELKTIIPEDQWSQLKPAPTKELLDAIALTNEVQQATNAAPVAVSNNVQGVSTEATNGTTTVVVKKAAPAGPRFRDPTEEEMDPASPEGEAYLAEKKAFYENLAKQPKAEEKKEEAADAAPQQPAEATPEKKTEQIVIDMNELWVRAYGCRASAIRIRHELNKLIKKYQIADEDKVISKASFEHLQEISHSVVEGLDQIKVNKDVDNLRKAISFIRTKGEKAVARTVREIKIAKLEKERKEKAEAAAAAEKERLERIEKEKKERTEAEVKAASDKFDAIVAQGCFRQLDWKSALRMLNALKDNQTTPEGQLAIDLQILKVNNMKMVQDIFISNLKGHTFKGKLRGCTVESVNEKEIVLNKKGVKKSVNIPWQKFYKDYPGNLNEIINLFIVNARLVTSKFKINSLLEWANAMSGAALTMQLVCSDVTNALQRADELIAMILEHFPDYGKKIKEIFPGYTPKETESSTDL